LKPDIKAINRKAIESTRQAFEEQQAQKPEPPRVLRYRGRSANPPFQILESPEGGTLYAGGTITNGLISRGKLVKGAPGLEGRIDSTPSKQRVRKKKVEEPASIGGIAVLFVIDDPVYPEFNGLYLGGLTDKPIKITNEIYECLPLQYRLNNEITFNDCSQLLEIEEGFENYSERKALRADTRYGREARGFVPQIGFARTIVRDIQPPTWTENFYYTTAAFFARSVMFVEPLENIEKNNLDAQISSTWHVGAQIDLYNSYQRYNSAASCFAQITGFTCYLSWSKSGFVVGFKDSKKTKYFLISPSPSPSLIAIPFPPADDWKRDLLDLDAPGEKYDKVGAVISQKNGRYYWLMNEPLGQDLSYERFAEEVLTKNTKGEFWEFDILKKTLIQGTRRVLEAKRILPSEYTTSRFLPFIKPGWAEIPISLGSSKYIYGFYNSIGGTVFVLSAIAIPK